MTMEATGRGGAEVCEGREEVAGAGMAIEQVREKLQHEVESLRSEIATLMQAAVQVG